MNVARALLLPVVAIAAACSGSGSTGPATATVGAGLSSQSASMPPDLQIANLVYDRSYSVPTGFLVDDRADTERSYTVHHVLDTAASYELCTDDYAVAMAWEDADNAARSVQGYFVESRDTRRYFEFVRELAYDDDVGNIDDLTSPGFARVFKCSHTDRQGVDRAELSGFAGRINAQPLGPQSIREFTEYLWQFAFFPVARKKVVGSYGSETPDALQHTLLLAFGSSRGAGQCDQIEVAEWQFSADRGTGEVSKRFTSLRTFTAKTENATVMLCN